MSGDEILTLTRCSYLPLCAQIEGCFPFLGIALGRRELVNDGHALLNWAERKAQEMAAARAGLSTWQRKMPAQGFGVGPTRASRQLLVLYRTVFTSIDAREAFMRR